LDKDHDSRFGFFFFFLNWLAIGGAEIYGADSTMPGAKGPWMTLAQKTYDQTYQQWDDGCGGGIYWVGIHLLYSLVSSQLTPSENECHFSLGIVMVPLPPTSL
jgi:hypothetical protein